MSLQQSKPMFVSEETARVAKAIYQKGNLAIHLRDELAGIYRDGLCQVVCEGDFFQNIACMGRILKQLLVAFGLHIHALLSKYLRSKSQDRNNLTQPLAGHRVPPPHPTASRLTGAACHTVSLHPPARPAASRSCARPGRVTLLDRKASVAAAQLV